MSIGRVTLIVFSLATLFSIGLTSTPAYATHLGPDFSFNSVHVEWGVPGVLPGPFVPSTEVAPDFALSTASDFVLFEIEPLMDCIPIEGVDTVECTFTLPNFIDQLDTKIIFVDITFDSTIGPAPAVDGVEVTCFDSTGESEGDVFEAELDPEGNPNLWFYDIRCEPNPDWETITLLLEPNVSSVEINTESSNSHNPLSEFEIIVDGAFDPLSNGEWSDVTAKAFISPPTPTGELFSTTLDDPNANAFTYAAVAPGFSEPPGGEEGPTELYLLYDYLERTNPDFTAGEFVADIVFPISVDVGAASVSLTVIPESLQVFAVAHEIPIEIIELQLRSISPIPICPSEPDFFGNVFFEVFIIDVGTNGGIIDGCASDFGIEAAVGFGSSPEGDARGAGSHMIIEVEVELLIPPEFVDPESPFPEDGLAGVYSPAPAFWGADIANDDFDPPASKAIFEIFPDGSTGLDTSFVPPPPSGPTSADHYLGYKVKETKHTDKFEKITVILSDQFESDATYTVEKPERLYNPVDKNGEGISDEITHLLGYKIKAPKDTPKFEKITNVLVQNQFGDITVDVKKPKLLLVPSSKDLTSIPDPLNPITVNHYKCYDAKETKGTPKFVKRLVTLSDPNFGESKVFEVKKPKLLCNPVEKQVANADRTVETTPIQNPENHLMCYDLKKIKDQPKFKKTNVFTNNQFEPEDLEVKKEHQLCVPSIKILVDEPPVCLPPGCLFPTPQ